MAVGSCVSVLPSQALRTSPYLPHTHSRLFSIVGLSLRSHPFFFLFIELLFSFCKKVTFIYLVSCEFEVGSKSARRLVKMNTNKREVKETWQSFRISQNLSVNTCKVNLNLHKFSIWTQMQEMTEYIL